MIFLKLYQHVESKLSTRERLVLKMRYGLYNEEEYTQREIAKASWHLPLLCIQSRKRALLKNCVGIFNTCAVFFPVLY